MIKIIKYNKFIYNCRCGVVFECDDEDFVRFNERYNEFSYKVICPNCRKEINKEEVVTQMENKEHIENAQGRIVLY